MYVKPKKLVSSGKELLWDESLNMYQYACFNLSWEVVSQSGTAQEKQKIVWNFQLEHVMLTCQ